MSDDELVISGAELADAIEPRTDFEREVVEDCERWGWGPATVRRLLEHIREHGDKFS